MNIKFDFFENICLMSDSYKMGHWKMYLNDTQKVYSYLEARNGAKFNKTVFYGLQYILKRYFIGQVVTQEKINEAEMIINSHLGKGVFNRAGWEYILNRHNGRLPLRIMAVPEGTPVDVNNVMMTVENTDAENCEWLTNFVETELLHVWYSMTVATLSRECKIMIKDYLLKTTNNLDALQWMLHDFGERSSTTLESAALAGSAHLAAGWKGTDTVPALTLIFKYYGADCNLMNNEEFNEVNLADEMPGFSVAATEHSIMTARGEAGEFDVVDHLYNEFDTGVLSTVIDSYNYENYITVLGTRFKDRVLNRNGRTVFRPDSGDPVCVTLRCLELLGEYFGFIVNDKGFKVLNDKVRVLWGDGIDYYGIRDVLFAMFNNGWSAENIIFGMGGGLHQRVNRDTQRTCFKCSAQMFDDVWHDVYKKPKDLSKASKRGRLALIKEGDRFITIREEELGDRKNYLQLVFENGRMIKEYTFNEVRENAKLIV